MHFVAAGIESGHEIPLVSQVASQLSALGQVLMIDLVLAGDNAVAVGLAAAALAPEQRKKAILIGLGAAVLFRIGFALITVQLLAIIGLLLAGGVLLLWVCWKMWRELQEQKTHDQAEAEAELETALSAHHGGGPPPRPWASSASLRRRPRPDHDRRHHHVAGQRPRRGRRGA